MTSNFKKLHQYEDWSAAQSENSSMLFNLFELEIFTFWQSGVTNKSDQAKCHEEIHTAWRPCANFCCKITPLWSCWTCKTLSRSETCRHHDHCKLFRGLFVQTPFDQHMPVKIQLTNLDCNYKGMAWAKTTALKSIVCGNSSPKITGMKQLNALT